METALVLVGVVVVCLIGFKKYKKEKEELQSSASSKYRLAIPLVTRAANLLIELEKTAELEQHYKSHSSDVIEKCRNSISITSINEIDKLKSRFNESYIFTQKDHDLLEDVYADVLLVIKSLRDEKERIKKNLLTSSEYISARIKIIDERYITLAEIYHEEYHSLAKHIDFNSLSIDWARIQRAFPEADSYKFKYIIRNAVNCMLEYEHTGKPLFYLIADEFGPGQLKFISRTLRPMYDTPFDNRGEKIYTFNIGKPLAGFSERERFALQLLEYFELYGLQEFISSSNIAKLRISIIANNGENVFRSIYADRKMHAAPKMIFDLVEEIINKNTSKLILNSNSACREVFTIAQRIADSCSNKHAKEAIGNLNIEKMLDFA